MLTAMFLTYVLDPLALCGGMDPPVVFGTYLRRINCTSRGHRSSIWC